MEFVFLNWLARVVQVACACSVVYGFLWPTRLLCPWNSADKSTGVGCHFLLQGVFPSRDQTSVSCFGRRVLYHWATCQVLFKVAPEAFFIHVGVWDPCRPGFTHQLHHFLAVCVLGRLLYCWGVGFPSWKWSWDCCLPLRVIKMHLVSVYIPTNSARELPFLHTLSSIYCL